MKKIYTLASATDREFNIHLSVDSMTYENALQFRGIIMSNEAPNDTQEELESVDENFEFNFWDETDIWTDRERDLKRLDRSIVWFDGITTYYIVESILSE